MCAYIVCSCTTMVCLLYMSAVNEMCVIYSVHVECVVFVCVYCRGLEICILF